MKFEIIRLEERIAPTRGTLYKLVSGMNEMAVLAKDTVTPLKDGSVSQSQCKTMVITGRYHLAKLILGRWPRE